MLVRCAAAAISPSMCLSHYGSITNCIQNSSIVRIFRDSLIVPNVFLEVIYPRSTGASVEPWGSRNLACSSYGKLRYLRSSSAFPAIGRFVVDNETATISSAAANGVWPICVWLAVTLFLVSVIFDRATAIGTRRRCPCLHGLPALAIGFRK